MGQYGRMRQFTNVPDGLAEYRQTMAQSFLVVYDYGQGGVWGFVRATSGREITERFPDLEVVDEIPAWMNGDYLAKLKEREEDIDAPSNGLLSWILQDPESEPT